MKITLLNHRARKGRVYMMIITSLIFMNSVVSNAAFVTNSNYILEPQDDYVVTQGTVFIISWNVNSSLNLTYKYLIDEVPSGIFNVTREVIEILYPGIGNPASLGKHMVSLHITDFENNTISDVVIVTIIQAYTKRDDYKPFSNTSTTQPEDFPITGWSLLIGIATLGYVFHYHKRRNCS